MERKQGRKIRWYKNTNFLQNSQGYLDLMDIQSSVKNTGPNHDASLNHNSQCLNFSDFSATGDINIVQHTTRINLLHRFRALFDQPIEK